MYESYCKAISIEAQSCLGLAQTAVLPAALQFQERLASNLTAIRAFCVGPERAQEKLLKTMTDRVNLLVGAIEVLQEASDRSEAHQNGLKEHALLCRDQVIPAMGKVREACDAIETMVDDGLWPLPKYREMLFIH